MKIPFSRLVFALCIASALVSCDRQPSEDLESFSSKSEWSALQGLEYDTRGKPVLSPQVRKVGEFEVLGVASMDQSTTIWILLRPDSPPYYKQMPDGNFVVPEVLLRELVDGKRISSTVAASLRSHLAAK